MDVRSSIHARRCSACFGGADVVPASLIRKRPRPCERIDSASLCLLSPGGGPARFTLQSEGSGPYLGREASGTLAHPLAGKEVSLYAKGYRWDLSEGPVKHPVVTEADANGIADYFEKYNKDPRVKIGAFDVSKVTKFEAAFGAMAYKAHACLGCHVIEENGKLIGGPQSASLVTAGQRYNMDWLFRFGQNPQDFTVHNGEFLADATEPQLRAVIGFLAVQGVPDFNYYEPWTSPEFSKASAGRGKVIYKEYCMQCHGSKGRETDGCFRIRA